MNGTIDEARRARVARKAALDCVPCLSRAALDAARLATRSESVQEAIVGETLFHLAMADAGATPRMLAREVSEVVRTRSRISDPYFDLRNVHRAAARALLPEVRARIAGARDPLEEALRLSAVANVVGRTVLRSHDSDAVEAVLRSALSNRVEVDETAELAARLRRARSMVLRAANAGEIVWDFLILEQLSHCSCRVVVAGAPMLGDALRADALEAGADATAEIVECDDAALESGAGGAGEATRAAIEEADLVLCKGHALVDVVGTMAPGRCWFLFVPVCAAWAARFGLSADAAVVAAQRTLEISRREDRRGE
ncbi:hypothetical protein ASA1KI_22060 [Opitutales bacterium ASA1]|uniref:ARMT1-like domain-containing protein n=1 Tax=Congregicoccus parvus TaxID=3081749 RepID=UPI002B286AB6|nr:hypothetical protein ASA1KI_22060 [Opitutales bacterium ASA1]